MIRWLDQGKWVRPSDTMAVYTEILPGSVWGIRVTLMKDRARVEVIDGEKCTWYKPGPEISADVTNPSLFQRWRGHTFESKLRREVEIKRRLARQKNEQNEPPGS